MGLFDKLFGPNVKSESDIEELKKRKDVRGLIKALKVKNDKYGYWQYGDIIHKAAILALGEIGDAIAVDTLYECINDGEHSFDNKNFAIEALGKIGDERAREKLLIMYSKYCNEPGSGWCIVRVVNALKISRPEKVVRSLIAYGKRTGEWHLSLIKEIGIGDRALDPLIDLLKDIPNDCDIFRYAAVTIGEAGDERAVEPLIQCLNNKDCPSKVIETLSKIGKGNERAVESLIRFLKDGGVCYYDVIESLGEMEDARAVEALIEVLFHENFKYREMAAIVLGKIGDAKAVTPLIQSLNDESLDVRDAVRDALVKIGKPAVKPLVQMVRDEHIGDEAAKILALIGDKTAEESLIQALIEKNWGVKSSMAIALHQMRWKPKNDEEKAWCLITLDLHLITSHLAWTEGRISEIVKLGKPAIEPLIHALKDETSKIKGIAAYVLLKMGYPKEEELVKVLILALKDESRDVRRYAAKALGEMGDAKAAKPLSKALAIEESPEVILNYVEALGELKDPNAIPYLLSKMAHYEGAVRTIYTHGYMDEGGSTVSYYYGQEKVINSILIVLKKIGKINKEITKAWLIEYKDDKMIRKYTAEILESLER